MENAFKQTAIDKPRNTEQKCLCVLCLDVSYSMDGEPLKALNEGVEEFLNEIKTDLSTSPKPQPKKSRDF